MEKTKNQIISFGKYKGKTLKWAIDNHINYVGWCITKGLFPDLSNDIKEKALREYRIEDAIAEAENESKHSDWGNRD